MVELRRADFQKNSIELLLDLDERLPDALASVDQIQQIIIILVNNALQVLGALGCPCGLRIATRLRAGAILI